MSSGLRIAIVYDRVFPASFGGVERWFRLLAESLAAEGHQVTYLTTRHWPDGAVPTIAGAIVIPLRSESQIYATSRRRMRPVMSFGLSVARFLARHGESFDVVHSTTMSPMAALAVVAMAKRCKYLPVLDWWEVWGTAGWHAYLGPATGEIASRLEARLARTDHLPVVYSCLHSARLARLRQRDDALPLAGVLPAEALPPVAYPAQPYVLMVNRLIPEKQTSSILPALALARQALPSLRAVIVGSGPLCHELQSEIDRFGLREAVIVRDNLNDSELAVLMQHALCLMLLSRREGFGLVALEAMRFGTPALVLVHPDSAASERVVENENGSVVGSLDPPILASAILSLHASGNAIRQRTLSWRRDHDSVLTIDHSLPLLVTRYQHGIDERSPVGWRNARP